MSSSFRAPTSSFLQEQDEVQKEPEHKRDHQQYHGVKFEIDTANVQSLLSANMMVIRASPIHSY